MYQEPCVAIIYQYIYNNAHIISMCVCACVCVCVCARASSEYECERKSKLRQTKQADKQTGRHRRQHCRQLIHV